MVVTRKTLNYAYNRLKSGGALVAVKPGNFGEYFAAGVIRPGAAGLFEWEHFGSSANKLTKTELKWCLETIFDDCIAVVDGVWSEEFCNYVPERPTSIDGFPVRGVNLNHNTNQTFVEG